MFKIILISFKKMSLWKHMKPGDTSLEYCLKTYILQIINGQIFN